MRYNNIKTLLDNCLLFKALESGHEELHISSHGVADSTLEEVFLQVTETATKETTGIKHIILVLFVCFGGFFFFLDIFMTCINKVETNQKLGNLNCILIKPLDFSNTSYGQVLERS